MKWIKRLVILGIILLAGGAVVGYLTIDGIVKSVVEKEGTEQLKVSTTLGGVSLGLLHGDVDLKSLAIASPPGFKAPQMFSVDTFSVNVGNLLRLRDEPIHLANVTIDDPKLVVEQHGTKINFRELIDNMSQASEPTAKNQPASTSKPVKLIIDTLTITNAHATVQSDIHNFNKDLTLPSMTLKNVGNADGANNGAAIKDVLTAVIDKMVDQTTLLGGLPIDLTKSLSENLGAVAGKLKGILPEQIGGIKLPDPGNMLNGLLNQKK
jgi:hypothetical protein